MNENIKKGAAVIAVIVIAVILWLRMCGSCLYSDRSAANDTRNELTDAGAEQRKETESLSRAESAVGDGRKAVRDGRESTIRIEDIERTDAEIISESKRILEGIRARGKTENTN